MLSVENISVSFGSFELLKDISFLVNKNDRIGLAGKNGAGKSTLLRIIAGLQSPTSGRVNKPKNLRIGYLPQQMSTNITSTVIDETLKAFDELFEISANISLITKNISSRTDYHSAEYMDLCDRLAVLEEHYRMLGGNEYMAQTEKTLVGLGFDRENFDRPTGELSEGWRMRIELAKIILRKPDLMLLDEPTNHLDIESIQWLESYLAEYPGAVIVVSHDRAFLDNVTKRTIEISLGKIYDYRVPWSEFVELRKERREHQLAAFRNQQKMIADTEKFIERFRYKATKAVQVQSRIKQLNKLERIEVDEEDTSTINIRFAPAPRSGTVVIEAEGLAKSYGDHPVLDNISLTVTRGEKVAFVGRNGEGKTTLSRIIAGELDYKGKLKIGHNVKIGYYAQNQDEIINEDKTVFQTVDEIARGEVRTRLRDILGAFLFRGEEIDKKVKVLSGGERSRLALVKLLLEPYNLLLLDEPTNHLDMQSKEILKQALLKYDGTLIVVSHDRDFLDGLVDKVYEFRNRKIKEHTGGIYDFLRMKKIESLRELETPEKQAVEQKKEEDISLNKQRYLEKKEFERNLRKLRKRVEDIENEIEEIENKIAEMDTKLSEPGNEALFSEEFFSRYNELKEKLSNKIALWEQYNIELDSFLKSN
ncbi:MAG TPA: ABC-F family ATP-binding cassette domain-containing protein [Bacteroidales bacterium]|nr:ABC-F family ATP-binding cassette domain-containing protein [Bacteroidales bacterium]HOM40411.1 ABC-F family ATP-binding cassette domain-containing protein [Bacteroidales bacterium]HPP93132.1 ABC-F family ATP-binding cassette domain-containing protein [Bacteroidales bacterium]HRR16315.1 ABC-F family ATP-binding cassette domain-containing protein [Bacteroidales bacterium]HRT47646.1 ABC-F family ATP-binding cassette domain-containing protein [Bacteroidales bacterium]